MFHYRYFYSQKENWWGVRVGLFMGHYSVTNRERTLCI